MQRTVMVLALLIAFTSAAGAAPQTQEAWKAWADDYFGAAFDEKRFSAASVTVIQNGAPVLLEAYGYEDPLQQSPARPAETRFAIASVTKVFTSIAIMQLYEAGLVASLDDPANTYLTRAKLPSKNGVDVTIRHLLTHQGGFDNRVVDMGTLEQGPYLAPPAFVARRVPRLVDTPGEHIVYSNIGMGLLGVIVEDVTGQTLDAYMEERIFEPLGLEGAVLNRAVTPPANLALAAAMPMEGTPVLAPFVANTTVYSAAGSILVSAGDMKLFAEETLHAARGGEGVLLSAEGYEELYSLQAQNHPAITGVGLGFFHYDWNGAPVIGHAGEKYATSSYLALFPEQNAALFVSTAGGPGEGAVEPRLTAYIDVKNAVFPFLTGVGAEIQDIKPFDNPTLYEGLYIPVRSEHSGIGRLLTLLNPMRVTASEDGFLRVNGGPVLGRIGAHAAGAADGDGGPPAQYAFGVKDGSSKAHIVYMNSSVAKRAGVFQQPAVLLIFFGGGVVLSLIGAIASFAPQPDNLATCFAKWSGPLFLALFAAIPALVLLGFPPGYDYGLTLFTGQSLRPNLISALAIIISACALFSIVGGLSALTNGWRDGKSAQVWTAFTLAAAAGGALIATGLFTGGVTPTLGW